ncbi:MAG: SDR family NAD(P)-dependent oxidoreductase [Bacteroidales bacterium]|nr:SDR family NAD(P)-dependent oxidoreductase [Bacteroidales bacterium]
MQIQANTVLITGACSGIGKIMARLCLQKGARRVIIWDINEEAIAATVAELSPLGEVCGFRADISDPESVQSAYVATKASCGDVDILINNAGVVTNNKHFAEQTDKDIIRTLDINTKGAMFVTLRYLKDMKKRGIGHICNVTSSAGMLALPRMALYSASKWAAIGWSESLRIELSREKSPVHVTTIAPYFINTGMFDGIHSFFKIQNPEVVARKTIRAIELDRWYRGIPFGQHFIRLMQGLFPQTWFDFIFGDVCGLYTVMDHFTGRKKEQNGQAR